MARHHDTGSARRLALSGCLLLVGWLLGGTPALVLAAEGRAGPTSAADAVERIDALRTKIAYHDELYFKKAAPVISDQAYDLLKRELAALETAFPAAAQTGIAPAGVGDDRGGTFPIGRHRARMLSLNKSYTETELRVFDATLQRRLGRPELEYVIEPKFDGLAISATYEHGKLTRAVTRGNGVEGDDVTANVLTIRTLPRTLRAATPEGALNPMPAVIELRGEIFISYPEFARLNRERESAGETPFAHPRNLAAGTVKLLEVREVAERRLEIVFYGHGACEPATACPDSQRALLRQLQAWGLPAVDAPRLVRGADAMWQAVQAIGRERPDYSFPTDGAVVKLNEVALQEKVGATPQAPLWAMAFKFAPRRVETQLRAITWQVGRTGVLTPVAELVPVRLGGARVARASLFNRDEILRLGLREGDSVFLEKAGEIIPAITGVDLVRRPADSRAYRFPTACPACQTKLLQLAGEAAMRCPNGNCPAQVRRRVQYFASAACVGIPGLGPVMVERLVAKGWVKNVADLYRLRREDLLTLGGHSQKSTDRLLASIEQSKHAELWRFVRGLGIPRVGEVAARDLARRFSGLPALAAVQKSDLFPDGKIPVAGLSEVAASAVLEYFAQPAHRALLEDLRTLGVEPVAGSSRIL